MKLRFLPVLALVGAVSLVAYSAQTKSKMSSAKVAASKSKPKTKMNTPKIQKITKTDAEWKAQLSPAAYNVLRHEGTERAFSGALNKNKEAGIYKCAGCDFELFSSEAKFESGTGWPSFFQPIRPGAVKEKIDNSYGMKRVAIECPRCDGHLGHVFEDGPKPTGLRYCMNSVALSFQKK